MDATTVNQVYLFGIYTIGGILIGIFFDLFRILRRSFKTSDIITYVEDIIFGIITGIFLIFTIFIFSNGELRLYIFIALALGLTLYLLTISKYFIKFNVKIITTVKKLIIKIFSLIIYPIKLLKNAILKIILKPFKILTINTNNLLKNKLKKRKKNKKTSKDKKDFSE